MEWSGVASQIYLRTDYNMDISLCKNSSLWDYELTINTTSPELTECFQDTLLVWIPCGLLWLISPIYLLYLTHQSHNQFYRWSKMNAAKVILATGLILTYGVDVIYAGLNVVEGDNLIKLISAMVSTLTSAWILFLMRYEFLKGQHSSAPVFIYWLLQTLAGVIPARSYVSGVKQNYEALWKVTFFVGYGLTCMEFLIHLFSDKKASQLEDEEENEIFSQTESKPLLGQKKSPPLLTRQETSINTGRYNPESTASVLSRATFAWVTGLIITGYKKTLQYSDLWDLDAGDRTTGLVNILYRGWIKSKNLVKMAVGVDAGPSYQKWRGYGGPSSANNYSTFSNIKYNKLQNGHVEDGGNPIDVGSWSNNSSLIKSLIRGFGFYFAAIGFYEIINTTISFLRPTLLDYIIGYVESGDPYVWHGYLTAVSLFLLNIVRAMSVQRFFRGKYTTGVHVRGSLTGAVYRKALRLSNSARNTYSAGQIVNLMSVDAQRVADVTFFIHDMWSAPVNISIAVALLYQYLGPASLAGLGVVIFLMVLNLVLGALIKRIQFKIMILKDQRIKLTNEILNGMKVIKLYAWEAAFETRLNDIRDEEVKLLRLAGYLSSSTVITFACTPVLYTVVAFSVFALTSGVNALTPEVAFVSLSLVNTLVRPLAYLPNGVANLIQAIVSVKRIENFLNDEELDESSVDRTNNGNIAVDVRAATFAWDNQENTTLRNINLKVKKGQLVAVVGQVGSGKSSLVNSILGELNLLQGNVNVAGSLAYVPQEAWIRNESLQDNILFGKGLNQRKYEAVLDACALGQDLKILPAGDQTEIGEKGINLSGGQKQRVSIARALYQDKDVYLLDDPLSAVDAHVGKHIFEAVFGSEGMLRNKTRVLVTHGVTYLPKVDVIVVLREGEIQEIGSYTELISHNGPFAEFIETYLTEEQETHDQEENEIRNQLRRQISALSTDQPSDHSGSGTGSLQKRKLKRMKSTASSQKSMMTHQTSKTAPPPAEDLSRLTAKETAESGGVQLSILWTYFKACGLSTLVILVLSNFSLLLCDVLSNIWLSEWSEDVNREDPVSVDYRLGIYGALGAVLTIATLVQSLSLVVGCTRAARVLHMDLLKQILRAPMSFFDTTPVGRILNRFSQDLSILDAGIRFTILLFIRGLVGLISTVTAVSYTAPIFLAFVVPLTVLYYIIQRFYVVTSNQLRRILSVRTSPIYSHFGESIQGASSIRAYRQQERFTEISDNLIDGMQTARYAAIMANRWLGIGMEVIGSCVVLFSALYAVIARDTLTGGLVGLSITYSLQITDKLSLLVQNLSDLETNIVAVERIEEYSNVALEAEWVIPDKRPPRMWPDDGLIQFKDYSTRYRPGLNLVLKDTTFTIHPQEKVGVVGRTGAGKSSMMLALFRIVESVTGTITIDGLDTQKMGLHDLREKLTIIPQDPVLFSGTLRSNLDPFERHSDEELWRALGQAHLQNYVANQAGGLAYVCSEGGQNLSVGQRQLICLARALLRKSKILVLDEATAAVDMETDDLIQQTIRTEFKECTILTIAHRLNTVLDYDRIMVLDVGQIKELAPPGQLLADKTSAFYSMAKEAGIV